MLSFLTEQKFTVVLKDRINIVKHKNRTDTELQGVKELCDELFRLEKCEWTACAPEDFGWKVIQSDSTVVFKIIINFLHVKLY